MSNHSLSPIEKYTLYAKENLIPLSATIEITQHCNFKCQHCYNFDRTQSQKWLPDDQPLSPDEVYSLIDQFAELGTMTLAFSGGEALLHPKIYDFIKYAKSKNFIVRLKSNGSLLNSMRTKRLAHSGLDEVDVSVYGGSSKSHDFLTQIDGSFVQTVQGIRNALDEGIFPKVNFILHRRNIDELDLMEEITQSLNIPSNFSSTMTARYDGSQSSLEHRITMDQYKDLLMSSRQALFHTKNPEGNLQCSCATTTCGVSATGKVYPCIGAPIEAGDLRKQSLKEVWYHSSVFNEIRNLKPEDFKSCVSCKDRHYCSRSSGDTYVDTGQYTGPNPRSCEEAQLCHELAVEQRN